MDVERELMRGAGPVAVLKLLERGEMYGYELAEALARRTDGALAMGESTLYPMLYNLEAKKLVASRVERGGARPRRYYRLTDKGKAKLVEATAHWRAVAGAMRDLGVVGGRLVADPTAGGAL